LLTCACTKAAGTGEQREESLNAEVRDSSLALRVTLHVSLHKPAKRSKITLLNNQMNEAGMYTTEGKKIVSTNKAPKAIGPYSQAIVTEDMVYTAGQVGLDPGTMEIVEGGIEAETRQVLTNLRHVLECADSGLKLVVKTTVFLQNMDDFAAMNGVYAEFFPGNPPARSTVAVAALPKGALVEIECIAMLSPVLGD
jgi:2-iminobutanoate/2-iminopropanoate deaminase